MERRKDLEMERLDHSIYISSFTEEGVKFDIYIYDEEEPVIPHFHLICNNFDTNIDIKMCIYRYAYYYNISKKNDNIEKSLPFTLSAKQLSTLANTLQSCYDGNGKFSIWDTICIAWNLLNKDKVSPLPYEERFNDRIDCPYNFINLEYTTPYSIAI